MANALELRQVSAGYGETVVLEDIDLALAPGENISIIGRNGVGKSTLLELIIGRADQRRGEIRLRGEDISALPIHDRVDRGVGYVPQQREVFPSLTVDEHLAIAARAGRWTKDAVFDLFPRIAERRYSLGRHLSGGEQQMLAIARALLTNPSLILMDEPSEGLAPVVVEQLVGALQKLAGDNALAVLLVEQRIDIALDMSSRCIVMDRGRIVHEGTSAAMRSGAGNIVELLGLSA
jgi:branched-chain amino acid transport system ATP-binding protein